MGACAGSHFAVSELAIYHRWQIILPWQNVLPFWKTPGLAKAVPGVLQYKRIFDSYFLGHKARGIKQGRSFETLCGIHPDPQGVRYSAAVVIKNGALFLVLPAFRPDVRIR
jgi:hypothetical protein